jgi:hypothetical protein
MDQPTVKILQPEIPTSWPPGEAPDSKAMYNRHCQEGSCHLLATDASRFLLQWDTSLGAMVGKMHKCQRWPQGGLMCTDLQPICHIKIRGNTEFLTSERVRHLNF